MLSCCVRGGEAVQLQGSFYLVVLLKKSTTTTGASIPTRTEVENSFSFCEASAAQEGTFPVPTTAAVSTCEGARADSQLATVTKAWMCRDCRLPIVLGASLPYSNLELQRCTFPWNLDTFITLLPLLHFPPPARYGSAGAILQYTCTLLIDYR